MVSKSQIKLITSLYQKKYRNLNGLFIAEGIKVINEFLQNGIELYELYTTDNSFNAIDKSKSNLISESELKKISLLKTPNTALALFKIPQFTPKGENDFTLALDNIRDPGNLGTIIRLCDWFGITNLICNLETVDCYNPKVVQASMGSLARINISYVNLKDFLESTKLKVYVADMEGSNVYQTQLPEKGILVMGNEANGISDEIKKLADIKLSIPRFGELQLTESLNVATATAILLSEFKRNSSIIQKKNL
jgi:TrmH family RNA methyltransferase